MGVVMSGQGRAPDQLMRVGRVVAALERFACTGATAVQIVSGYAVLSVKWNAPGFITKRQWEHVLRRTEMEVVGTPTWVFVQRRWVFTCGLKRRRGT
jgi:hypothetical protein